MASGFQIGKCAVGVQTQTGWDAGPATPLLPGAQGRGRACPPKGEGLGPNREGGWGDVHRVQGEVVPTRPPETQSDLSEAG